MSAWASEITGVFIVCLTVCSGADQWKHQSYASLAFVRGIHRWPLDSPHKGPVTRKMFSFDDVIMWYLCKWPRSSCLHVLRQYIIYMNPHLCELCKYIYSYLPNKKHTNKLVIICWTGTCQSDSINYHIEVFLRKKKHYISNGMEKMLTTE